MATFYSLVALYLLDSILAQIPSRGACPCVKGQSDFDISKFTDDWYEAARICSTLEPSGRCTAMNFKIGKNGAISADKCYISKLTGKRQSFRMDLQGDSRDPSKLMVKFPLTRSSNISECWVLGTDYNNYAVMYCCVEYGELNLKDAWIFTREKIPKKSVMAKAYEVIDSNDIDRKYFWTTDQNEC